MTVCDYAELKKNAQEALERLTELDHLDEREKWLTSDKVYPGRTVVLYIENTKRLLECIVEGNATFGNSRLATNIIAAVELLERSDKLQDVRDQLEYTLGNMEPLLMIDGYNLNPRRTLGRG